MRLTKLALVFLVMALIPLGFAQDASKPADAPVVVPPHSPVQLLQQMEYPWTRLVDGPPFPWHALRMIRLPDRTLAYSLPVEVARRQSRSFQFDSKMNIFPQVASSAPNTCFKLKKYIFQPPHQTEMNGIRPLGDEMQMVGQTDCTYANRVQPKSVDKLKPPKPNVGVQSTVFKPE